MARIAYIACDHCKETIMLPRLAFVLRVGFSTGDHLREWHLWVADNSPSVNSEVSP